MTWLCAVLVATMTLAVPSTEEFERGKTAFGRAEYARAIAILRPLLYPEVRLDSEADVVQAHRLLGVAHLFENQPDSAKQEFRKLLELRSDYRFDPLLDPPRVVEFFNRVIKEEEDEIAVLDSKRKQRDAELAARRQREADAQCAAQAIVYSRHSYALNFMPFGAGQFQNGQGRKGWAFLGAEIALGAVSLGALTTNLALFGLSTHRRCLDPPTEVMPDTVHVCQKIDQSQEDLSRNLVRVQVVSGGLFLATALWGIIDAVRNFHPLGSADSEPRRTGSGTSPSGGTSPVPASTLLRPTPIPVAGGSGVGLEWSY